MRSPDGTTVLVTAAMVASLAIEKEADELPEDWIGIIASFLEIDIAETTVVLHAVAAMTEDDVLRVRIRRELASRRQPVPGRIVDLAQARVTEAWVMDDELGDGDNVIVGVTWPAGEQASATIYIDHNMGTIVKDAFVMDAPIDEVIERYREIIRTQEPNAQLPAPLGLADAKARIVDAIRNYDELAPTWTQDQWPACRAVIELFIRTLPDGGTGYPDPTPSSSMVMSLVQDFLESPQAQGLEVSGPVIEAAAALFEFGQEHSNDPLRWSPVVVEIALTQALPFDGDLGDDALDAVGEVLPALVRFAHDNLPVRASMTRETLDAIPRWLPVFDALRGAQSTDLAGYVRRVLMDAIGCAHCVEELDDVALPDEPLDLEDVPADLVAVVVAVSDHIDRFVATAPEGWGVEYRTACRRVLTTIAEVAPEVLRRRAKVVNTAAALAWLVARANGLLGYHPPKILAKDLAADFGLTSAPTGRARTLRDAFTGGEPGEWWLGDPGVLVGSYRRGLIDLRDRYWE